MKVHRPRATGILVIGLMLAAFADATAGDPAVSVRTRYGVSRFDEASMRVLSDSGSHVRIALSGSGAPRTLDLEHTTVRGPHFELLVQGPDGRLVRRHPRVVRTFRGWVPEEPDVVVSGVLGADGLSATAYRDGNPAWYVRPLRGVVRGASRRHHVIFAAADVITPAVPPATEAIPPPAAENDDNARAASVLTPSGPQCGVQQAELGIDAASSYYAALGSSVEVVQAQIEESVNAMNAVYVRDAMLEYRLGRVIVRTSPATDPYTGLPNLNDILVTMANEWNTHQADSQHDLASVVVHGFAGSGLAWLGGACTPYRYAASGSNPDLGPGFDVVLRHELGHVWGSPHFPGGAPEGSTIMSGNGIGRISAPELYVMLGYRETLACLNELGPFTSLVEPYGHLDGVTVSAGGEAVLDVLANDHDANCEPLELGSFDSVSVLQGVITRTVGTGVGGRDELRYVAPAVAGTDSFSYEVIDDSGASATGKAIVEVLPAPAALYEAEDAVLAVTVDSDLFWGFSGRGYGAVLTPGGSIEWTVSARTATTARLALRYARPDVGSGELRVNGTIVAGALSMPTTTDWTIWSSTASVPVALQAGANVVRFTYLGPWEMHVDQLRVEWDDVSAGNAPPRFRAFPIWEVPATAGSSYSAALGNLVDDPDTGDSRTFTLVDGPAWMHVTSDGHLVGTPSAEDVGVAVAKVRVTDSLGASAIGIIRVSVEGVCGNGVLEAFEECDDGNTADGDCCSGVCQYEPAGTVCDDGNKCTAGEVCNGSGMCGAGACQVGKACGAVCGAALRCKEPEPGLCKCK